jgi:hypothetical protein
MDQSIPWEAKLGHSHVLLRTLCTSIFQHPVHHCTQLVLVLS